MKENLLKKIGLTKDQSKIYSFLLTTTLSPVRVISKTTNISRELVYVVLDQLVDMGLVERVDDVGKVALFRALHPKKLSRLVDDKVAEAEEASSAFARSILEMTSVFNSSRRRPGVDFFEGLDGIAKVYDTVTSEAKEAFVFRSYLDKERNDIRDLVSAKLTVQAKAGVKSYVLTPYLPHMSPLPITHDSERRISRKIIPKEKFSFPAMIIVWNKKVAICSLTDDMTTIIENDSIAKTFKILFQYIWDKN